MRGKLNIIYFLNKNASTNVHLKIREFAQNKALKKKNP